jgi:hypothetical protein
MGVLAKHIAGISLVFVSNSAFSGDYIVWGAGNDSCATFVQERARGSARFNGEINWIAGSVTRANGEWSGTLALKGIKSDLLKGLDHLALDAWLANYCKEHPLSNLNSAALALEKHLYGKVTE